MKKLLNSVFMCNYIFQNVIITVFILLYYLLILRKGKSPKELMNVKQTNDKSEVFFNWTSFQGWLAFFAFIILNIIGYIDKWLSVSIILKIFGIYTCLG